MNPTELKHFLYINESKAVSNNENYKIQKKIEKHFSFYLKNILFHLFSLLFNIFNLVFQKFHLEYFLKTSFQSNNYVTDLSSILNNTNNQNININESNNLSGSDHIINGKRVLQKLLISMNFKIPDSNDVIYFRNFIDNLFSYLLFIIFFNLVILIVALFAKKNLRKYSFIIFFATSMAVNLNFFSQLEILRFYILVKEADISIQHFAASLQSLLIFFWLIFYDSNIKIFFLSIILSIIFLFSSGIYIYYNNVLRVGLLVAYLMLLFLLAYFLNKKFSNLKRKNKKLKNTIMTIIDTLKSFRHSIIYLDKTGLSYMHNCYNDDEEIIPDKKFSTSQNNLNYKSETFDKSNNISFLNQQNKNSNNNINYSNSIIGNINNDYSDKVYFNINNNLYSNSFLNYNINGNNNVNNSYMNINNLINKNNTGNTICNYNNYNPNYYMFLTRNKIEAKSNFENFDYYNFLFNFKCYMEEKKADTPDYAKAPARQIFTSIPLNGNLHTGNINNLLNMNTVTNNNYYKESFKPISNYEYPRKSYFSENDIYYLNNNNCGNNNNTNEINVNNNTNKHSNNQSSIGNDKNLAFKFSNSILNLTGKFFGSNHNIDLNKVSVNTSANNNTASGKVDYKQTHNENNYLSTEKNSNNIECPASNMSSNLTQILKDFNMNVGTFYKENVQSHNINLNHIEATGSVAVNPVTKNPQLPLSSSTMNSLNHINNIIPNSINRVNSLNSINRGINIPKMQHNIGYNCKNINCVITDKPINYNNIQDGDGSQNLNNMIINNKNNILPGSSLKINHLICNNVCNRFNSNNEQNCGHFCDRPYNINIINSDINLNNIQDSGKYLNYRNPGEFLSVSNADNLSKQNFSFGGTRVTNKNVSLSKIDTKINKSLSISRKQSSNVYNNFNNNILKVDSLPFLNDQPEFKLNHINTNEYKIDFLNDNNLNFINNNNAANQQLHLENSNIINNNDSNQHLITNLKNFNCNDTDSFNNPKGSNNLSNLKLGNTFNQLNTANIQNWQTSNTNNLNIGNSFNNLNLNNVNNNIYHNEDLNYLINNNAHMQQRTINIDAFYEAVKNNKKLNFYERKNLLHTICLLCSIDEFEKTVNSTLIEQFNEFKLLFLNIIDQYNFNFETFNILINVKTFRKISEEEQLFFMILRELLKEFIDTISENFKNLNHKLIGFSNFPDFSNSKNLNDINKNYSGNNYSNPQSNIINNYYINTTPNRGRGENKMFNKYTSKFSHEDFQANNYGNQIYNYNNNNMRLENININSIPHVNSEQIQLFNRHNKDYINHQLSNRINNNNLIHANLMTSNVKNIHNNNSKNVLLDNAQLMEYNQNFSPVLEKEFFLNVINSLKKDNLNNIANNFSHESNVIDNKKNGNNSISINRNKINCVDSKNKYNSNTVNRIQSAEKKTIYRLSLNNQFDSENTLLTNLKSGNLGNVTTKNSNKIFSQNTISIQRHEEDPQALITIKRAENTDRKDLFKMQRNGTIAQQRSNFNFLSNPNKIFQRNATLQVQNKNQKLLLDDNISNANDLSNRNIHIENIFIPKLSTINSSKMQKITHENFIINKDLHSAATDNYNILQKKNNHIRSSSTNNINSRFTGLQHPKKSNFSNFHSLHQDHHYFKGTTISNSIYNDSRLNLMNNSINNLDNETNNSFILNNYNINIHNNNFNSNTNCSNNNNSSHCKVYNQRNNSTDLNKDSSDENIHPKIISSNNNNNDLIHTNINNPNIANKNVQIHTIDNTIGNNSLNLKNFVNLNTIKNNLSHLKHNANNLNSNNNYSHVNNHGNIMLNNEYATIPLSRQTNNEQGKLFVFDKSNSYENNYINNNPRNLLNNINSEEVNIMPYNCENNNVNISNKNHHYQNINNNYYKNEAFQRYQKIRSSTTFEKNKYSSSNTLTNTNSNLNRLLLNNNYYKQQREVFKYKIYFRRNAYSHNLEILLTNFNENIDNIMCQNNNNNSHNNIINENEERHSTILNDKTKKHKSSDSVTILTGTNGESISLANLRDLISNLSAKVCHEFRNPITNILGMLKKLKKELFKKQNYLDVLKKTLEANNQNQTNSIANSNLNINMDKSISIKPSIGTSHNFNLEGDNLFLSYLRNIKYLCHSLNISISEIDLLSKIIKIGDMEKLKLQIAEKVQRNTVEINFRNEMKFIYKIFANKINLSSKKLIFAVDIDDKIPVKIKMDSDSLKKILFILIENAIKFSNNGQILLKIFLFNDFLSFIITDEGIGIKQSSLSKNQIGSLFFKEDNANNPYGLGLGLFLFKLYMFALNGKYTIDSNINLSGNIHSNYSTGTTVKFDLPITYTGSKEYKLVINNQGFVHDNKHTDKYTNEENHRKHNQSLPIDNTLKNEVFKLDSADKIPYKISNDNYISDDRLLLSKALRNKTTKRLSSENINKKFKNFINNSKTNFENIINKKNISNLNNGSNISTHNIKIQKCSILASNNKLVEKSTRSERDLKLNINYKDVSFNLCSSNNSRNPNFNSYISSMNNNNNHSNYLMNYIPGFKNANFKISSYSERKTYLASGCSQVNILIVDDEEIIRKSEANVIKKFFKKNKIEAQIYEAADGVEGLYKIYLGFMNGFKFDLIITDETMNFMKGTTMTKILKNLIKDNILYDVKVCMITSYESSIVERDDNLSILDMIITKPLSNNHMEIIHSKFFV